MSYFAGIDLHKRYLTLCVLDPDANVVVQRRRLTTDGLFPVLAELDGPIIVAVEPTLHWAWLYDRLVAQAYAVQVAGPGPRGSAPDRIWMGLVQTPGIQKPTTFLQALPGEIPEGRARVHPIGHPTHPRKRI